MFLKKILLILFLFSISVHLFAQDEEVHFVIDGRLTSDEGRTDGATITIEKDGQYQEVVTPPRTGRFLFKLDFNHEYRLTFKREGFFQKVIIISTYVPNKVLEQNNKFPPLSFVLNLFKETDVIDKSFTIKPVARVFYNAQIDNIDSEIYLSDEQLREQILAAQEARDALASERKSIGRADEAEQIELEKRYDKLIADADVLYHKNNYENAISKFREAIMLFNDRPYPKDRIAEIEDLVAALQLAEETEQNYLAAIKAGDEQFNATQYNDAIVSYEKALTYKAKDKYATDRIAESQRLRKEQLGNMQFNDLIARADEAYNTQVYPTAKGLYQQAVEMRPRDSQYARDQIQKIDQELARLADLQRIEEQYAAAMNKGNSSFNAAAFPAALTAFKEALSLKPSDEPAQERIADTEAALQQLADNEKYNDLISKADEWFDKKVLDSSKDFYQQARAIKPNEQYPQDRIAEIDRQQNLNQQLEQLLTEANANFDHQEYPLAKTKYQQVLAMNADHELAQNRITEIDRILAQHAIEDQYAAAITAADQAFTAQQLALAKSNYQQALEIKSGEKYPQDQIDKIDLELQRITNQAALDEQYSDLIQQADASFNSEVFENAITSYEEALKLKPGESYPSGQIAKAKQLIAERLQSEQLERSYLTYISKADSLFSLNQYQTARTNYADASQLKPVDQYPRDQISKIDLELQKLADQAALDEQYAVIIKQADEAFNANSYEKALTDYESALKLKPTESYPTGQVVKVKQLLAERLQAEQLDSTYLANISRADSLFSLKNYQPARNSYAEASHLKPTEQYPKDQIRKIDLELQKVADQTAMDEQYASAIEQADAAFNTGFYENAITTYESALKIKPNETYPIAQIEKSKQLIAERIKTEQLQRSYLAYLSEADSLFQLKNYQPSKDSYADANRLKPTEQYPKDKIAEIDAILAEQEQQKEVLAELERTYNAAIKRGDDALYIKDFETATEAYNEAHLLKKEEVYPVNQLATIERLQEEAAEQAYRAAIQKADALFNQNELVSAKPEYQNALALKVNDTYATNQIAIIDQRMREAAIAEAEKQKLEETYVAKIAAADQAFNTENYSGARPLYQEALALKASEQYPATQISKIDGILEELAKQAQTDARYNQAMTSAKASYDQDLLDEALTHYKEAANIKPLETEPPQRIAEIEQLKTQRLEDTRIAAEAEALRLAAEKARREKYNASIDFGDVSLEQQAYAKAQGAYTDALSIFPEEQYPKDKLAEIEDILQELAQAEAEQRQKAWEDSIAAANLMAFNLKIAEAEAFIDVQKLENAIGSYREAIVILPEKAPTVQPKINELEDLIAQLAKIEADYLEVIQIADGQFNNEAWEAAKSSYLQAINVKPQESYPKNQIEKIELKLVELELLAERTRASEKTVAEYNEAIQVADENFEKQDYSVAQFYYQKASSIQPENTYPKQRLNEISQLIDQSLAADQIKAYNDAIGQGDTEFDRKGYTLAKFYYNKALAIKSWEKYPKDRIKEIEKRTNTLLSQREEEDYLNWINTADEAFVNKDFAVARAYYQRALALKKDEPYPSIKLAEIQKELETLQSEQTTKEYQNAILEADKAFENKNYSVARFYYNKAIELRPNEQYPKDQLKRIREVIGGN